MDRTVRIRVESEIECAVCIQARNVVARHSENAAKGAADENLAVGLNRSRVNKAANGAEIVERPVERAVRFQPSDAVARLPAHADRSVKKSPRHDFAVRL